MLPEDHNVIFVELCRIAAFYLGYVFLLPQQRQHTSAVSGMENETQLLDIFFHSNVLAGVL